LNNQIDGLFWPIDPPKSTEARKPPEPVWLAPDYLPGLEEARAFNGPWIDFAPGHVPVSKPVLICDIELYGNYFLAAFKTLGERKFAMIEARNRLDPEHAEWLRWLLCHCTIVTFNGNKFDIPILTLALAGCTVAELKHAANMLIVQELQDWVVLKSFKVQPLQLDHIDIFNVCPLANSGDRPSSLKTYGGRLFAPKLQDLPFHPETMLSEDQITILRFYCTNDLDTTELTFSELAEQISIRVSMSEQYETDLRSKSDAQIAEAVIKAELKRLNGWEPERPEIAPGTSYVYTPPAWLKFQTPQMQAMFETVRRARFVVEDSGSIAMPPELNNLAIPFGKCVYRMGIGGLHLSEKCQAHLASDQFKLVDMDVASYYPSLILNQKVYPIHLGHDFAQVYRAIVERRIAAKNSGNKLLADVLKIVANGTFGKFGSKWSCMYSPDSMIQVTLTGQLMLLMLIESMELAGVQVCSANTDGIVLKYPRVMEAIATEVAGHWQTLTGFTLEATEYAAIYSRDVNNYLAVKPNGKTKAKGYIANPWADPELAIFRFHKNPTNLIVSEAVAAFLTKGVPVAVTVNQCRDFNKFLTVRQVQGGGVKDGVFLGKVVRWYYSNTCGGEIVTAKKGNLVAGSEGGRACMQLPDSFPDDVDFRRYEAEANAVLRDIGAISGLG